MTQGTMSRQPLAWARKVLQQLAFVLGLSLGLLAAPAAHAEDCWQLPQDAGGILQLPVPSLPGQCLGRASDAVSFVLAHATETLSGPTEFYGHTYWSYNFYAANTSNGLTCPQVGNEVGAQESCTVRYTSYHRFPSGVVEQGESGNGWFAYYLIKCPDGTAIDLATNRCISTLRISLTGPSSTKALPGGPVLPHTAIVTSNGAPAAGKAVSIAMSSGGAASGTTDAAGQFRFTYIPPRKKALDQLTASCSGCVNTAQKTISVEPCDVCEGKKGNPINVGASEKEQDEPDWQDASAHPLSLVRHYRSFGSAGAAGLGGYWSHGYAPLLTRGDLDATLKMGDASKVLFQRNAVAGPWIADNRKDILTDTPTGALYTRASDESRYAFDASGKLQTITQRNGWVTSLAYNAAGQLASVTNAFGRALQFSYDAQGRLTTVTTPDAQTIGYSYDTNNRLTAVTYPGGASRGYDYEDARWPNALTGIRDEGGTRYATFAYDEAGRAVSTQHAGGVQNYTVNYGADTGAASGTLSTSSTVDPALYRSTVQVTDPQGNAQTYVYQGGDGNVRLLGGDGAYEGGQVASRSFVGATTLPQSETDFLGVTTQFTWDTDRQLKMATTQAAGLPEAQTRSTQWHATFRLPVLVTEPGKTTAYTYDGLGNKLSETTTDSATGQARTWAWTYNSQGLNDSLTDPLGKVWRYGFDAAGNRVSIIDPLGQETRYTFDGAGRVLSQASPNRPATAFSYDARGRLLSQARGQEVTSYSYTPTGQLASATEPGGLQANYTYDAAQRLVAVADNRGASIQYTLDALGNRVREDVKDANGNTVFFTARTINSLNRVASFQGAGGYATVLGYDANGEQISSTDPFSHTTRQSLDGLRRPTAITLPDEAQATQAWNPLDQLTQVTDPKGVATQYTYNAFGEVLSETSPDIGTLQYTRDAAGNIAAIQDAKGQITNITRDALGRPTQILYAADNAQVNFQYNGAGDVMRIEDRSGSTAYERDALGRITAKTQAVNDNPSAPSLFKLGYAYTNGNLVSITYPSGLKVFYTRGAGSRITGIDVQEPGGTVRNPKPVVPFVSNLAHTALGQPKAWNWASGDAASRSYDGEGRMSGNEFAHYEYDAASRITDITQRLWASRTVTSVVGTATTTTTTVTELYQTPLSWFARYDSRDRITDFARDGASTRYSYDANSNRLSAMAQEISDTDLNGYFMGGDFTQTTGQTLNLAPTSNRLLGLTQTVSIMNNGRVRSEVTTPVSYTLDANGALTSDGLRSFDYDAANRMSRVTILKDGEAASISYLHNALGQRVFKGEPQAQQTLPNEAALGTSFIDWLKKNFSWLYATAQANTSIGTAFIYGDAEIPAWALLGNYDNGSAKGAGRTEYIWLPTEDGSAIPIGLYRGGQFYAIHTDHLGTPRLMTNEANTPVWQWPYSAFGDNKPTGVLAATANPKAAITNRPELLKATAAPVMLLRFPGQVDDVETGTFYNYFRSYDARQGRYTQGDPIGLSGGLSRFSYTAGNPLSLADPRGLIVGVDDAILLGACTIVVTAMIVNSQSNQGRPHSSSWVDNPQAAAEHNAYSSECRLPPPKELLGCELLKWKLAREQFVVGAMIEWDARWMPGRHALDIAARQRAIEALKKEIQDKCEGCPK